jgi:hypothetical protein
MEKQNVSKIEKLSLKLFWCFMILCAISFLGTLWSGTQEQVFFRITATFFVIGLANFLIWLPLAIYRLIEVMKN